MNYYLKLSVIVFFIGTSLDLYAQESNINTIFDLKYNNYKPNLCSNNTRSILLINKELDNTRRIFIPRNNNYYSLFNKYTGSYEFYSSSFPINFKINQAQNYQTNYSNIDSFNPYGSKDIFTSLFFGTLNYILEIKK